MSTDDTPTDVAILKGYDSHGSLVYSVSLDRGDYWDGEHVWDQPEGIRDIGMTKLIGKLYDADGLLYQEFENLYSPSGQLVGGTERWSDGTQKSFGGNK